MLKKNFKKIVFFCFIILFSNFVFSNQIDIYVPKKLVKQYLFEPFYCYAGAHYHDNTCGAPPDQEPMIKMPIMSIPELHRYEGVCTVFTTVEEKGKVPDDYEDGEETFKTVTNTMELDKTYHTVDWDRSKMHCEKIGGAWTDQGGFDGYRCCGDDYTWIFDNDKFNFYVNDEIARVPYDPNLKKDEDFEDQIIGSPDYPFFFAGRGKLKNDVGKWSGSNNETVLVCYHNQGSFFWLNESVAANRNELLCEIYLGYNWTGSKCCGLDDDTYDDPSTHCDPKAIVMNTNPGNDFLTPPFERAFNSICDQNKNTNNRVCFKGEVMENNTIGKSSSNVYDVYSVNGRLNFCTRSSGNQIFNNFKHVNKCGVLGTTRDDLVICGYTNDSWQTAVSAQKFMGFDYSDFNKISNLELGIHDSVVPFSEGFLIPRECCFFDRCWNGTKCVDELEVYSYDGSNWKEYVRGNDEYNEQNNYYVCSKGSWTNSDIKHNFYKDNNDPGFCNVAHSCYCPQNPNYPYNFECNAKENEVFMDCTINENFYSNDNYCQANNADSEWTTRTKLVAIQLILLAEDNDYVLFCDDYEQSINYPLDLSATAYPLNSVCVIEFNNKRIMGFTFNPPKENEEDSLNEFLFNPSNGFVNYVFGNRTIDEDEIYDNYCYALNYDNDNSKHGRYVNCVDNSLWVSKKINAIIYSKEGIEDTYPIDSYVNYFNIEKERINQIVNSIQNTEVFFSNFKDPTDFSRIYALKKGNKEIFGLIEKRYDEWKPSPPKLMNYMFVRYKGFENTCNFVNLAKDTNDYRLDCFDLEDETYVFSRTSINNPEYWKDLTAKLRIE
jgi:hypothetical protein